MTEGTFSEERLSALLSITSRMDGFLYRCRNDATYTMLYISEGIQKVSGYPAIDFENNKVREYTSVIHPDDLSTVYAAVAGYRTSRQLHCHPAGAPTARPLRQ